MGAAAGGVVQFLNKVVDVPVVVPPVRLRGLLSGRVLQRFVEQIIDKDGLTVQKTVHVPQLPSRWVVQFLDKVVDMPVVVQRVDKVVDVPVVQVLQFIDGLDVAMILQRQVVSRTVEVPQTQFIARVCRHSSSQQRRAPTVQTVQPSGGWRR